MYSMNRFFTKHYYLQHDYTQIVRLDLLYTAMVNYYYEKPSLLKYKSIYRLIS